MSPGCALRAHIHSPPRTPICESRQLGRLGNRRKGAGGSADWCPFYFRCRRGFGNFGCFFYRWSARLLTGSDSSSAQRNGGRVRTPAPTQMQGRFHSLRRGRSQTGPRAATWGRPYGSEMQECLCRRQLHSWGATTPARLWPPSWPAPAGASGAPACRGRRPRRPMGNGPPA